MEVTNPQSRETSSIQYLIKGPDIVFLTVTYIIVGKRHHTRLFPAEQRDRCGGAGYVPPGAKKITIKNQVFHKLSPKPLPPPIKAHDAVYIDNFNQFSGPRSTFSFTEMEVLQY